MFIDQADITKHHFASFADRIVMDPQGLIQLGGFVMGRTFLKGTLEEVGVGFDEWRFFKYKSANESLSRDKMSDADREQLQKLVDDNYRHASTGVCASRGLPADRFDTMMNNEIPYMAANVVQEVVAAPGGYWLSIYADTIVAAPTTITGSIGVVGEWVYNKGARRLWE